VNPYEVAFREAKSAVKSQGILEQAREFPTVAEAVADCALVIGTTSKGHRTLEHPLRRLIRRMNLNAHDAEVWLGIVRQILWKLVS
jgi:tRNA C32,U32 (ribose-2'-O)-methylase TrmJ